MVFIGVMKKSNYSKYLNLEASIDPAVVLLAFFSNLFTGIETMNAEQFYEHTKGMESISVSEESGEVKSLTYKESLHELDRILVFQYTPLMYEKQG